MSKYLYGASVQGIQSYIFQTGKLKEIVGASELVEQVCTTEFEKLAKDGVDGEKIIHAAGNVKFIFNKKSKCEEVVRNFPRTVMELAPGITISQSVVEWDEKSETFKTCVNKLEKSLREQRNKPMPSLTIGLMGIIRSRQTGLPAVWELPTKDDLVYLDAGTRAKLYKKNESEYVERSFVGICKDSFGEFIESKQFAFDIEDITDKNSWIAIVHADGNGLGRVVERIGSDKEAFKLFSNKLDEATKSAAQEAFNALQGERYIAKRIPIRPVVLGGDDHTVIIRGDLAIAYCEKFLSAFETKTKEYFAEVIAMNPDAKDVLGDGLTACAGIAFIKESYPFYYGYELAESLCKEAKTHAKKINDKLAPSCLMFHKVQDSFVEGYEDICRRELQPCKEISFKYGPYYVNVQDGSWTIERLTIEVDTLKSNSNSGKDGNALNSNLRNWMSILTTKGKDAADQKAKRIIMLSSENIKTRLAEYMCVNEHITKEKTPIYDMLALHSINTQQTK